MDPQFGDKLQMGDSVTLRFQKVMPKPVSNYAAAMRSMKCIPDSRLNYVKHFRMA